MCIRLDGDEGLFASYSDVQFTAPVRAGDVLEITATLVKEGTRSRVMDFVVTSSPVAPPSEAAPGAAERPRPAGHGHDGDRHGRRTGCDTAGIVAVLGVSRTTRRVGGDS